MNENIEIVLAELDGFRMADEMTYAAYSRLHDSYGVDFERILNPDDVTHWMPLPEKPKEET